MSRLLRLRRSQLGLALGDHVQASSFSPAPVQSSCRDPMLAGALHIDLLGPEPIVGKNGDAVWEHQFTLWISSPAPTSRSREGAPMLRSALFV
jgi:hypothetical protein